MAYTSLKMALDGLANMTDGLPWPLKAIPQTLMQLMRQAEVRDIPIAISASGLIQAQRALGNPTAIRGLFRKIGSRVKALKLQKLNEPCVRAVLDEPVQEFLGCETARRRSDCQV